MSYKNITAGEKLAKAKAARFIKSSKGTMGFEVKFDFVEPSTNQLESLTWVGWLTAAGQDGKKGALENTMTTLVDVLDFNGNDLTNKEGLLIDPNVLDWNKEVKLVVEFETNPNDGKQYPKVKWVNNVGGSAYAGCQPDIIKNDLGALGFKAAFLAAKQKSGQAKPSNVAAVSDQEVPF